MSGRNLHPIRQAFRARELQEVCSRGDFSEYASRVELSGEGRFYHYRDNGSSILAVCHLDTVQRDRTCRVVGTTGGLLALSGALDDRLGTYVILHLLPRLGIHLDWLLTTDEERGQSTAAEFETSKRYQWMVSFDRGGTDVVMYDYETPDLRARVSASGARVGVGSYSDICELEHLGCAGFNWGIGYRDYHSKRSHAWLSDTFAMVARFVRFYEANAAMHLAHAPRPRLSWDPEFEFHGFQDCPACFGQLLHGFCPECDIDWMTDDTLTA